MVCGSMEKMQNGDVDNHARAASRRCNLLRRNAFTLVTMSCVGAGVALGVGLRAWRDWTPREISYLEFPGEIFLRMLNMLIIPLIFSSLVHALGNLDFSMSSKVGGRAVLYYMVTTILAIILGVILVVSVRPGISAEGTEGLDADTPFSALRPSTTVDTLLDLLRNLFPPNIFQATFGQYRTVLVRPPTNAYNATGLLPNQTNIDEDLHSWKITHEYTSSTNFLGIVMFSLCLGAVLCSMKEKGKPLLDTIGALSEAMMGMTKLVIWISPVGILFLIAAKTASISNYEVFAGRIGKYTGTVLGGLAIHSMITLPLIYTVIVRANPFRFVSRMSEAIITAFATASSAATLPVSISCLENRVGVDPRVSRFVLPVGATINMDGTALYEAVAAIFIAQTRGVVLDVGKIIAISVTATAASVGAAGIPQAGLVTMVMVLNTIGLPASDVGIVLVVDWLLDRFRTAINVLGDAYGAAIVEKTCEDQLAKCAPRDRPAGEATTRI
ncbi:hypothetical protein LAZ67_X003088 [Cordylochernes scorpioides]|uniref:Amino acid transporter n=1 Tax=Cordylochernes scorpioides TaxID=51811 RepID=A0ABY6LUX8_9ARAC|nr:hypothetical protein LAZ67_X003088 [Cordylochernes scorpioides]